MGRREEEPRAPRRRVDSRSQVRSRRSGEHERAGAKHERDEDQLACEDEELRPSVRRKASAALASSKPAATSLDVLDLHVLCHLMECERESSREKDKDDEARAALKPAEASRRASRSPCVKRAREESGDGDDDMELALEGLALSPSPPSPFGPAQGRPHTASSPCSPPEQLRTPGAFTLPSPPRKKIKPGLAPSLAPFASSPGRSWTTLGLDAGLDAGLGSILGARRTRPKACRSLDFSLPTLSESGRRARNTAVEPGRRSFDEKDAIDVVMSHKYGRPEDVMDADETDDAAAADDEEADATDAMEEDAENRHLRAVSLVDVDTEAAASDNRRVDRGALMEVMSAVGGGRTNASIGAVPWRVMKLMQIEEEIFII